MTITIAFIISLIALLVGYIRKKKTEKWNVGDVVYVYFTNQVEADIFDVSPHYGTIYKKLKRKKYAITLTESGKTIIVDETELRRIDY
jgi:hypothetical protein